MNTKKYQIRANPLSFFEDTMSIQQFIQLIQAIPQKPFIFVSEITNSQFVTRLYKAAPRYGVKIIRPLRNLCLYLFDKKSGLTCVHVFFLQKAIEYSCEEEALPVIQKLRSTHFLNPHQIQKYFLLCFWIYFELRMLKQIKKIRLLLKNLPIQNIDLIKILLLMNSNTKQNSNIELRYLKITNRKFTEFQQSQLYHYYHFNQSNKNDSLTKYKQDGLYQVYKMFQMQNVRVQMDTELRPVSFRFKTNNVLNVDVGNFQIIKNINMEHQIYKYDSENQIMYFNHLQDSQQDVNKMVSQCFNIQKQIQNFNEGAILRYKQLMQITPHKRNKEQIFGYSFE